MIHSGHRIKLRLGLLGTLGILAVRGVFRPKIGRILTKNANFGDFLEMTPAAFCITVSTSQGPYEYTNGYIQNQPKSQPNSHKRIQIRQNVNIVPENQNPDKKPTIQEISLENNESVQVGQNSIGRSRNSYNMTLSPCNSNGSRNNYLSKPGVDGRPSTTSVVSTFNMLGASSCTNSCTKLTGGLRKSEKKV